MLLLLLFFFTKVIYSSFKGDFFKMIVLKCVLAVPVHNHHIQ